MKNNLTDHEKRQLEASLEQMKPLLTLYLLTPYQVAKALEKKLMLRVTPTMVLRRVGPQGKLFKHEWPKSSSVGTQILDQTTITELLEAIARSVAILTTPAFAAKPALVPLDPVIAEFLEKIDYPAASEPEETDADVMSNRFDPAALDKKAIHV